MNGILVIDKPRGLTSHDVVMVVKKRLGAKKAGHIGTLDPIATGILPVCINGATRLARFLEGGRKEYVASIKLGEETDTYDAEGNVVLKKDITSVRKEDIIAVVHSFRGRIRQTPPMFSAIKVNGVALYRLARQGVEVERAPRDVEIYDIHVEDITFPFTTVGVTCSKGTYVRSLAFDIGRKLGCGAHLVGLRRTSNGIFSVNDSVSMDNACEKDIIPVERLFADLPGISVDEVSALRIRNGLIPFNNGSAMELNISSSIKDGEMIKFTLNGRIIALANYKDEGGFKLERVFKETVGSRE